MTVEQLAYRNLTELHRLLVVDVETTVADDADGLRIVELAVVEVVNGKPRKAVSWLINPAQPIDKDSQEIHGITDRMVARKPLFADIVDDFDDLLNQPDTVFGAHNAGFDTAALRGEYHRIGKTWPTLPTLDTMTLHRAVGHRSSRRRFSLTALCADLDINRTAAHRAAGDARATAKCLVALLHLGAAAGISEMAALLESHGNHTTASLTNTPTKRKSSRPASEPTSTHLATHTVTLADSPTQAALEEWADNARACVETLCPLAVLRAETASQHSVELLALLTPIAGQTLPAGQPGTLAGVLAVLAVRGLDTTSAPRWWRAHKAILQSLPTCGAEGACPSCEEGDPCPLDVVYQSVAVAACGTASGPMSDRQIKSLVATAPRRRSRLATWCSSGLADLAGFAAWLAFDTLDSQGHSSRASSVLATATGLGLEHHEPRLALAVAKARSAQGRWADAGLLAEQVLATRTTDDGFDDLRLWLNGTFASHARRSQVPTRAKIRTLPRSSRPADRHRSPRFKF